MSLSGVELKHATMKHAQTIGLLERTHASVKTQLKAATGEFRHNWHKFPPVSSAQPQYNLSWIAWLRALTSFSRAHTPQHTGLQIRLQS